MLQDVRDSLALLREVKAAGGFVPVALGGTGATTAAGARAALGLAIGTDVLAPIGNGSGLTNLNAGAIATGTVPAGRLPDLSGTYLTLAGNGSGLTNLNAGALAIGTVPVARLATGTAGAGKYLDGTGAWVALPDSGVGTVTSVGLATSGLLHSVSGSPVTGSGTLTLTLLTQAANTVLAGPTTGAAAQPTMRALVAADLPTGDPLAQYAPVLGRAGAQTVSLTSDSGGSGTLQATSGATPGILFLNGATARVNAAGNFSRPPTTGTNSEQFGSTADASGSNNLAAGVGAVISNVANCVAVGTSATVTAGAGTAIGNAATAGSTGTSVGNLASTGSAAVAVGKSAAAVTSGVAVGSSAATTNSASVSVGSSATAAFNATALGSGASAAFTGAVALGMSAAATATNQCVIGSATAPITNLFLGSGVAAAIPTATTTINAGGGSGTDVAGTALVLAGGRPTGAGVGGSVKVQTAPAGATGATLRVLADRLTVESTGNLALFGAGSYGGGALVAYLANCAVAPTTNPVGGSLLYSEAGALKYRSGAGAIIDLGSPAITEIAPALAAGQAGSPTWALSADAGGGGTLKATSSGTAGTLNLNGTVVAVGPTGTLAIGSNSLSGTGSDLTVAAARNLLLTAGTGFLGLPAALNNNSNNITWTLANRNLTFANSSATGTGQVILNQGTATLFKGVANAAAVSNKALASNVATLTTTAAHSFGVGASVVVAGVDATFNGTYTIASVPTSTTFTYARTAGDVAPVAATGTATADVGTNLAEWRTSANAVRFAVDVVGNLRTANATAATTLGAVTRKLPIYDAAGNLLGYAPIYDAIT
jgi:hypothetical protein